MHSEIAISVKNLTKTYRIFDHPGDRLKQAMTLGRIRFHREFTALQDISFEVKKGESLGIVGRNGSGKSTLLQLTCGILKPTSGAIEVHGRISALLELGAGFNPEFTGRENVFFQGAVTGFSKAEMEARFDGIAAFADIGEFIDQPVRTYSSGMYVRLAFAVSIASDPEIMIVDEALAVGDIGFQSKCMTAHTRLQSRGTTLLFVSHDMESLKSLCSRGVYLERGVIREIGPASRVAEHYTRRIRMEMSPERTRTESKVNATKGEVARVDKQSADSVEAMEASTEFTRRVSHFRYGEGGAGITYGELLDENLQATNSVRFDQSVHIRVHFGSSVEGDMSCNYYVMDDKKNLILGAGLTLVDRPYLQATKGGKYVVTYKTRLPLLEGNYSIQLQITTPALEGCPTRFLDVVEDAIVFHVSRRDGVRIWSKVYIENEVEISSC